MHGSRRPPDFRIKGRVGSLVLRLVWFKIRIMIQSNHSDTIQGLSYRDCSLANTFRGYAKLQTVLKRRTATQSLLSTALVRGTGTWATPQGASGLHHRAIPTRVYLPTPQPRNDSHFFHTFLRLQQSARCQLICTVPILPEVLPTNIQFSFQPSQSLLSSVHFDP